MSPDPQTLQEVVDKLEAAISPVRIILFGSAARGEMGPDSDLDLLVVVPDSSDRREAGFAAYDALAHLRYPKDIVVVRQQDLERYAANPYMVIHTAMTTGRELYRVAS